MKKEILTAYSSGLSVREVAEKLNIGRGLVWQAVKEAGTSRTKARAAQGKDLTAGEILKTPNQRGSFLGRLRGVIERPDSVTYWNQYLLARLELLHYQGKLRRFDDKTEYITLRDLMRSCKAVKTANEILGILSDLTARGYVKVIKAGNRKKAIIVSKLVWAQDRGASEDNAPHCAIRANKPPCSSVEKKTLADLPVPFSS